MIIGMKDRSLGFIKRSRGVWPQSFKDWMLLGIVAIGLGVLLWGVRRQLPYVPEVDERDFVFPALGMAISGDLNPHWFGHPGSTVIYPLAALYHLWNVVQFHGPFLRPDPTLWPNFWTRPSDFFLLGRFLGIGFAVMTIPLVYAVGRRAFNDNVGLVGAGLYSIYPIAVSYAQQVRTDSAATFFGMFSLYFCLKAQETRSIRSMLAAGLMVGLSIGTRYFMLALVPVLLLSQISVLWNRGSKEKSIESDWWRLGEGLLAIGAAFFLSTPFLFLDSRRALIDLSREAEVSHLGADGLDPASNLWWYLTQATPQSITWLQTLLMVVGFGIILRRHLPNQILILVFVIFFLVEISLPALHWTRWLIQLLPLFALSAAYAAEQFAANVCARLGWSELARNRVLIVVSIAVAIAPAYQLILSDIQQSNPTTRILAREWILQNIPRESRIAQEWYAAPLAAGDFISYAQNRRSDPAGGNGYYLFERFSVAQNRKLEDYASEGYQYIVVSSAIYGRYFSESKRYEAETAFYRKLFSEAHLLREFTPSFWQGGPIIRVYKLASLD